MQTSKFFSLSGLLISLGVLASVACAAPPVTADLAGDPAPPPGPRTKTDAAAPAPAPEPAPGTKETAGPGAKPTAASCKQTAPDACHACCEAAFPGIAAARQVNLACICAPDACQTACKELTCSGRADANAGYEDDACFACEFGPAAETCSAKAQAVCDADPSCKGIMECYGSCPVTMDGEQNDDGGLSGGGGGAEPKP